MATKQQVEFIDDMDGTTVLTERDATGFRFAIDGHVYELDTTAAHAEAFRAFVKPYVDVAHKVGKLPASGPYLVTPKGVSRTNREVAKLQREWANANGWNLAPRGRVPNDVVRAWEEAQQAATTPAPRLKTAAAPATVEAPRAAATPKATRAKAPMATTRATTTTAKPAAKKVPKKAPPKPAFTAEPTRSESA